MKKHLAITGFMGSGKTTYAHYLSQKTNIPFVDLDEYIEQKEKSSIASIFENKGESYFREIETEYLKEILNLSEQYIIALGGGTICFNNNLQIVLQHSWLIALMPPVDILIQRLWNEKEKRPLIKNFSTQEELKKFIGQKLSERNKFYLQADIIVKEVIY